MLYSTVVREVLQKIVKMSGIINIPIYLALKILIEIIQKLGGKKFLSMYLTENGMSEEEVNKKMIEITDKIYGQPFDEDASKNCDNYVYNLIPGSKEKMDELGSNQY